MDGLLKIAIIVVGYFVVINYVFPRLGLRPG